jgi:hypothetical protein
MKYLALSGKIQYRMLEILENDGLMVSYKLPILDIKTWSKEYYWPLKYAKIRLASK